MTNELDRRSVLRIGGLSVALGAIVAACGTNENGSTTGLGPEKVSQIGTAPPLRKAGSADISDNRLLRTATSMHHNGIDLIDRLLALNVIPYRDGYDTIDAARHYRGLLEQQAAALADATAANGGAPFTEKNPAIDKNIVARAIELIEAGHMDGDDAARFLHAFATLAAETHQSFVPLLSKPELRGAAMAIGSVHHRMAAVLARTITGGNTGNIVEVASLGLDGNDPMEAAVSEEFGPKPVALFQVPGAYGPLGAVQIVLGQFGVDSDLKRTLQNFETPSLNSLVPDPA